jgi:hypothetical protein
VADDRAGYGEWRLSEPFHAHGDRGDLAALLPLDGFGAEAHRVIAVNNVPPGSMRGGHGHQRARQAIYAVTGTFDIVVSLTDDLANGETVAMSPSVGALVAGPGVWLWLQNFSPDAVAVELFDLPHDPTELL